MPKTKFNEKTHCRRCRDKRSARQLPPLELTVIPLDEAEEFKKSDPVRLCEHCDLNVEQALRAHAERTSDT